MNKTELKDFLKDYQNNSETIILSESKQKDELIAVAKKKGILVDGSFDLAVFKTIYTFTDKANGNKEMTRKQELLRALPTLIGKPVNIDHIRRYIVGYLIDYRFVEKDNKVIAYGIFFKNAFAEEWEEIKQLFKDKKLATSHEIWSDKNKDEILEDGTVVLHDLQIAGEAILLKTTPAFPGAKVLKISVKAQETLDRVKASLEEVNTDKGKYQLVYACVNKDGLCRSIEEDKEIHVADESAKTATPPPVVPQSNQPVQPNQTQKMPIVCVNCGQNFEHEFMAGGVAGQVKCPNCWCVLDQTGKVVYPAQIKNFSISCPECQTRDNWLITESKDRDSILRCMSCSKDYKVTFKDEDPAGKLIKRMQFLRTGKVRCIQCGKYHEYAQISTLKTVDVNCSKCGIKFTFDVGGNERNKREIEKISEIKLNKSNKGVEMITKKECDCELKIAKKSDEHVIKCKECKFRFDYNNVIEYRMGCVKCPNCKTVVDQTGRNLSKQKKNKEETEMSKEETRKLLRKAVAKIRASEEKSRIATASLVEKDSKIEKFVGGIKKFSGEIKTLRKSSKENEIKVASLEKDVEATKKFYMESSKELVKRQASLDGYEHGLSEEDILDPTKYELAVAKKKIAEMEKNPAPKPAMKIDTASLNVGDKPVDDPEEVQKQADVITAKAFPVKE